MGVTPHSREDCLRRLAEVAERLDAGAGVGEVAAELGVCRATVTRYRDRREAGWTPYPRAAAPACGRGHPWTEGNTVWRTYRGRTARMCRACTYERNAGYRRARRAAAAVDPAAGDVRGDGGG